MICILSHDGSMTDSGIYLRGFGVWSEEPDSIYSRFKLNRFFFFFFGR